MATALDVANYFLGANPPESITDLKLQKLCSYSGAVAVAYLEKPLFADPIEMWALGPVIRSVYDKYKHFDDRPIEGESLNLEPFSPQERLVLAAVNDYYNDLFDAWGLCEQSHRDFPGVRGSNASLSMDVLANAFRDNILVRRLKDASSLQLANVSKPAVSEEEFWNAVSA